MKTKLTILILFMSSITFAQHKFEISLTGGGNYIFIQDSSNPGNTIKGKFAYQIGSKLSFRVFKNFKIGVGGIYTNISSVEIFKKIPEDDIFNYDIYVKHTLKFTEFPVFIHYDLFTNKKIIPYVSIGISAAKISELKDKLIKTDPTGHETDFRAQFLNFTFKNDMLYTTNMRTVYAEAGTDYKINNSFNIGINVTIKRYSYYEFDTKKVNFILSGNLTFSYEF